MKTCLSLPNAVLAIPLLTPYKELAHVQLAMTVNYDKASPSAPM